MGKQTGLKKVDNYFVSFFHELKSYPINYFRNQDMASTFGLVCLVLFLIFLAYFIVGIIVNFRHGATGWELIPQLEFWKSIPGACVGCVQWLLFTCNLRRRNQNAYEEI